MIVNLVIVTVRVIVILEIIKRIKMYIILFLFYAPTFPEYTHLPPPTFY